MSKFPSLPPLHRCKNRGLSRVYALAADCFGPRGGMAPRSFKTDGASIPALVRYTLGLFFRFLRWKFKRGLASAIQHDHGYAVQDKPRWWYDLRYYRDMRLEGYTQREARIIYKTVRRGGGRAWRKNAKRERQYFFCSMQEMRCH